MIAAPNSIDQSLYFKLVHPSTGVPVTGATITDLDITYVRDRAAAVKADLTALAQVDSVHADNRAIEIDATNAPGLYRVDFPDAAFASGVSRVQLVVNGAAVDPAVLEVELAPWLTPITAATVRAVDGADAALATPTNITAGTITTVTTLTGHTAQTGDSYAIVSHADYGNAKLVRSTTPANTLDVSATGEAGLDFANIKAATGPTTLTNITVPTVTTTGTASAVTAISAGGIASTSFAAGAIDAAAIAAGAIDNATFAADVGSTALATNMIAKAAEKAVGVAGLSLTAIPTIAAVTTVATTTNLTNLPAAAALEATLTAMKGATFNGTTDSLEALRDRGDSAWVTATGFATPTNITAGTITTVTNLTNAPTNGDLTATMKTSVTTAATAATPTAAAVTGAVGSVTGAVGSVTGNVGGNVVGSVGSVSGDTKQTADVATLITTVGIAGAGLTVLATQASVNTIDDFLDTEIAAILADTNELQLDWANGGRLDLILDAASAPSAAAVADAVWDEALAGHAGAGSAGAALSAASAPSAASVADAVWDELLAGHVIVGSAGAGLAAAGSAGDPWSTPLPGAYGAGTAGKLLADMGNSGTYSYSNTVDDGSGNLLDGVYVTLATDSGFTNIISATHTNSLGAFTVYSDIAGTHYLRLQLAGYSFTDQTVTTA